MKQNNHLWIKNSHFDNLFFISFWPVLIFCLILFISLKIISVPVLTFLLFYNLVIRYPHFFSTLQVSYFNKSVRYKINQRKFLYYAVPILILANYLLPFCFNGTIKNFWIELNTSILYIWGFQHISMQNYGIFRIYRNKEYNFNKLQISLTELNTEKLIFIFIWLCQCYLYLIQNFYISEWLIPKKIMAAATIIIIIFYLFHRKINEPVPSKNFLYLFKTPAVMYLFFSSLIMSLNLFIDISNLEYFTIYNFHHSIAYLGLVWVIYKKNFDKTNIQLLFIKFYSTLFVLSLVFIFFQKVAIGELANAFFSQTLTSVFVVHYYLEAINWKAKSGVSFDLIRQI